ncbi:MAG: hypothetical protein ABL995_16485 [Bryobacteraceae bacterium]
MSEPLRQASGVGLLVLGVIGCLLPVMPGIPFLMAGVAILGTDHVLVRGAHAWLCKKGLLKPPSKNDDSGAPQA